MDKCDKTLLSFQMEKKKKNAYFSFGLVILIKRV